MSKEADSSLGFKYAEGSIDTIVDKTGKIIVTVSDGNLVIASPISAKPIKLGFSSEAGETSVNLPQEKLDAASQKELLNIIKEGLKKLRPGQWHFNLPSISSTPPIPKRTR